MGERYKMQKEVTVSDNDFESSIKGYIEKKNFDYSILITGEWGIGKTYYFKNRFLVDNGGSVNNADSIIVFVSVGGFANPNQVKESIGLELIVRCKKKEKTDYVRTNLMLYDDIISFLPDSLIKPYNAARIIQKKYRNILQSKILTRFSEKLILIIDDLDRYGGDISELLAFVHGHYVSNRIHVIYVANEKEIEGSEKNSEYKKTKEKYIRFTLAFTTSISEIIKQLIKNKKETSFYNLLKSNHQRISDWIASVKISNLRTIILAIDCCDFINGVYTEEDKEYIFKLILLHTDYLKTRGKGQNNKEEFAQYLKGKGLNPVSFIFDNEFFQDKSEFPYVEEISNLVSLGYISSEEKAMLLNKIAPVNNEYYYELIKLNNGEIMEKEELLNVISSVLSGIELKKIPYGKILDAVNIIEPFRTYLFKEINNMNYEDLIIAAVTSDYPGKNDYFSGKNNLHKKGIQNTFAKRVSELLEFEFQNYKQKKLCEDFSTQFDNLNKHNNEFIKFRNKIFPLICQFNLLPRLKYLNNCGIAKLKYELENIDDMVKQDESIKQVISQIQEDTRNENYDNYAIQKREELINIYQKRLKNSK